MSSADQDDLSSNCGAIQLALPANAVFTHLTSAALRGWRMPVLPRVPIIASTAKEAAHHDRRGVYVRRCDVPSWHREDVGAIRIASPEWTVAELAEDLGLIDLVAVIDGALHTHDTTIERLLGSIVPGRRGARVLRNALAYVDGRSESWWETVLRMAHQLAEIPVESQVEIFNRAGYFVARTDLHIVGTNRYPEYDGSTHREMDRHRKDLRREKGMARLAYERYGYTSDEIVKTPTMVIEDAEDALGWPHDTRRLKRWLYELDRSSVSKAGWARLQRRLKRFDRQTPPRSKTQRVAQARPF
ncbi:hypothetical protein [Aeromicrobium sp.]|uniref:hypothetical protein n=1 Tax=Aeromicrobium sp. TaxID=1871063 RepID=UPI002FC67877